jgi:glutathione S-transferase
MVPPMQLYQIDKCPFAHRARIVLEEKKLPYEVKYYEPKARPAELDAVSADAKSPTLFDGDTRVWESNIVIEYLEERYPEAALMPKDPAQRARARLFMREVDNKLAPTMGPVVQELVYKPEGARDDTKVAEGVARFLEVLASWEPRLQGKPYLLGDAFTLADIALYTPIVSVQRLVGARGEIPAALKGVRAWRERVAARPSTAY